ncbi:MAG: hypothetical protein OQK82_03505 [Candidatus Pacearchaeota archaeon]|nr:hypothetical protein [Candidatus Pacearchaeota archaeon]
MEQYKIEEQNTSLYELRDLLGEYWKMVALTYGGDRLATENLNLANDIEELCFRIANRFSK